MQNNGWWNRYELQLDRLLMLAQETKLPKKKLTILLEELWDRYHAE